MLKSILVGIALPSPWSDVTCAEPDVTSSSVTPVTSSAPFYLRTSTTVSSEKESMSMSPSSVASPHLAPPSDHASATWESLIPQSSTVVQSSQFPPVTGGGSFHGQEPGVIIGAVVTVVVVLVVGSVIVAASLIAWGLSQRGKEVFSGGCSIPSV